MQQTSMDTGEASSTGPRPALRNSNDLHTLSSRPVQHSLRTIETSNRYFWAVDHTQQWSLTVTDKSPDGTQRSLPKNELTVMALNEMAAKAGRGYFFHLRNKEFWKKAPNSELCPPERKPQQPGAQFPEILYMHYEWDKRDRSRFLQSTHRSRYLRSDGLVNLPPPETPLYAIQFVSAANYPLYSTSSSTLVLLETEQTVYLATTKELEEISDVYASSEKNLKEKFNVLEVGSLKAVYRLVIEKCRPRNVPATYNAGEFQRDVIPRSTTQLGSIPLGTPLPLAEGTKQPGKPSRRKRRRKGQSDQTDEELLKETA
ncbi:hypothetical protein D6D10_08559 [Aureobasidium pullulans]|uniref:Uncharacterized protein n=1 Tax=Aureobasidium pullulans TaxID=5580 RepID=A0A4S9E992_AURPU|nr:hypothetical protein D6D10_08559 [Aureobasidium pullulans]